MCQLLTAFIQGGGEHVTEVGEIYICKICGNSVEVVAAGAGRLVCCGQPMELVSNADSEEEEI
jgi:desulfoferrodoxin-like iron-binding protein